MAQWQERVRLQPSESPRGEPVGLGDGDCARSLSVRNGAEAVELAQWAVELSHGHEPIPLNTLAAAYAQAGRFAEATETARKALDLATRQKDQAFADSIKSKIALYEAHTAYVETTPAFPPLAPAGK